MMSKTVKRTAVLAAAIMVSVAACVGQNTDVKGAVQSKAQEQECGKHLGMASMVTGRSKPGSGSSNTVKKTPKITVTTAPKSPTKVPTQKAPTSAPAPAKTPKGSKVKAPKTCQTEYELVIGTKNGPVEQDVTAEVYAVCDVKEQYPACGKDA